MLIIHATKPLLIKRSLRLFTRSYTSHIFYSGFGESQNVKSTFRWRDKEEKQW